jgi:hypothetical protein
MMAAGIFYSCEENNDAVIDSSISAPLISGPFLSNDTVFTTSASPDINFTTAINVNTNDGSSITSVTCTVFDPNGLNAGIFNLSNNGSGTYSANINISGISCLLVGNYKLEYIAQNASLLYSNLVTANLRVINTDNLPPVIVSTNLPDSVIRPSTDSTLLTISVNVSDPNGVCDIKDVTFVTTRPNGVVFPPIPMFNNGNGEFVFSNYVRESADPTAYGYFKYAFTARDNSNLLSATVTDSIKFVYP